MSEPHWVTQELTIDRSELDDARCHLGAGEPAGIVKLAPVDRQLLARTTRSSGTRGIRAGWRRK